MRVLISGHRKQKLQNYNEQFIKDSISFSLELYKIRDGYICGYSGMASGVDLWFCTICLGKGIRYVACPPFEGQEDTMDIKDAELRGLLLEKADKVMKIKNSKMVELCDAAIIVFDGNKGGTANVFQQLIENKKPFYWINPVKEVIWSCL